MESSSSPEEKRMNGPLDEEVSSNSVDHSIERTQHSPLATDPTDREKKMIRTISAPPSLETNSDGRSNKPATIHIHQNESTTKSMSNFDPGSSHNDAQVSQKAEAASQLSSVTANSTSVNSVSRTSSVASVSSKATQSAQSAASQNATFEEYINSPRGQQNAIVERSPGGRYVRFLEKLGSGASKDVYRAYDTTEGIEVAWNVVQLSGVPKAERNRIVNEVRLLERLHHANIISFHGSWVNRERQEVNFVTEILSSGTLKSFINKVQVIRWKIAKRWAVQILQGLNYLHSQDPPVIHRDLKCENIFINGTSGDLRIGDLGLSTVHRNGKVLSVLGTPEFMAPDLYDESAYDEKVDIYAFGMCLLEIFTKDIPYRECSNPAQIYKKVMKGKLPESLSRLKSKEARDFIMLCLGYKDESGKYIRPSAKELLSNPFLEKGADDESEVEVFPQMQEQTIEEGSTERPNSVVDDEVPVPKSRRSSQPTDDGSDKFDEMPDSEVNIKKVKVLMGRGQELKEDDDDDADNLPKPQETQKMTKDPTADFSAAQQPVQGVLEQLVEQQSEEQQPVEQEPVQPLLVQQPPPPPAHHQPAVPQPPPQQQSPPVHQPSIPQPPQQQPPQQPPQQPQVHQPPIQQAAPQQVPPQHQPVQQPSLHASQQEQLSQQLQVQEDSKYLVAAAVIEEDGVPTTRPYHDDILKLIITLPVDGQTQNVQFDFHLVEDDAVQVAKEMVAELGIPQEAVLEVGGAVSALARQARMKQEKYRMRHQEPQQSIQHGGDQQSISSQTQVSGQPTQQQIGVQQGQQAETQLQAQDLDGLVQQSGSKPLQLVPPHQTVAQTQAQHHTGAQAQFPVGQSQQEPAIAHPTPTQQQHLQHGSHPHSPVPAAPPPPAVPTFVNSTPSQISHQPSHQIPQTSTHQPIAQQQNMHFAPQSQSQPQMQAPSQQQGQPLQRQARPVAMNQQPMSQQEVYPRQQHSAVSNHVPLNGKKEVAQNSMPAIAQPVQSQPTIKKTEPPPLSESDGCNDEDEDEEEDSVNEELRRLDEDFQKNFMRAQKVFDNRMDNLQRSKEEKEAQHKKTLEKHQKERLEYEKRVQQEQEEQTKRLEKIQREWESKREKLGKGRKKQAASTSVLSAQPPVKAGSMASLNSMGQEQQTFAKQSQLQAHAPAPGHQPQHVPTLHDGQHPQSAGQVQKPLAGLGQGSGRTLHSSPQEGQTNQDSSIGSK